MESLIRQLTTLLSSRDETKESPKSVGPDNSVGFWRRIADGKELRQPGCSPESMASAYPTQIQCKMGLRVSTQRPNSIGRGDSTPLRCSRTVTCCSSTTDSGDALTSP